MCDMNEATIIIGLVCTVIGAVIGIYAALGSAKKDIKEEAKAETSCSTRLEVKLDYVSKGVDDIKLDFREQSRRIDTMSDNLIRVEESCKSAHKRINDLEKGMI